MTIVTTIVNQQVVDLLNQGGIGVLRTDTLYGVVARADNEAAVEKVFAAKGRTDTKSPIVLISALDQLFDVYDQATLNRVMTMWPGPNSIILPSGAAPHWITRGNQSVAYRMPADENLRALIGLTGPLIAPSANPEGLPPAFNVNDARNYFSTRMDFYVDGGVVLQPEPSSLYRLLPSGEFEQLR